MRRWETYVALIAVVLASMATIASSNRLKISFVLSAVGLLIIVGISRLRALRKTRTQSDLYDRIERIRDSRNRR